MSEHEKATEDLMSTDYSANKKQSYKFSQKHFIYRRKRGKLTGNEYRKKQRSDYKHLCNETEYIIKNGMRYVKPYIYRHETNCKQVIICDRFY